MIVCPFKVRRPTSLRTEHCTRRCQYVCVFVQIFVECCTTQTSNAPQPGNLIYHVRALPTARRYCDAFLLIAANHTFAGDPTPRPDATRDGGPLHGWAQTSGYNAVVALDPDTALICYDRQGWGGGYYGVGLPPVFGPKGAWPKGRAEPLGCYLDFSSTFCMRATVRL